ncbi:hypothetical protein XENORESO_010018 [Xenotaenia resolanae]|uniref:Uncharacterized protein n=1 Tax=Xenotaenia resolanae TaxID=208358 RepID=A0ABV0VN95_9TELE
MSTESTTKCTHLTLVSSTLERQSKLVFLQTIYLRISSPTCTTDIHQPPMLRFIFSPSEDFLQLHSISKQDLKTSKFTSEPLIHLPVLPLHTAGVLPVLCPLPEVLCLYGKPQNVIANAAWC